MICPLPLHRGVMLLIGFSLCITSCARIAADSKANTKAPSKPFNVIVIGEKTGSDCFGPGKRPMKVADPAAADGCAIAAGANAALGSVKAIEAARLFNLVYRDDTGDDAYAEVVAREIQGDPSVLAVIGHTSSETTRRTLPIYAQAGIPVLVPVATSPKVAFPKRDDAGDDDKAHRGWLARLSRLFSDDHWDSSKPLANMLRLIPNDSVSQAPAIAYAATKLAPDHRWLVVADLNDNPDYARALFDSLTQAQALGAEHTLLIGPPDILPSKDVKLARVKNYITEGIMAESPRLLVFCGTKERARMLILGLQTNMERQPGAVWPDLLLSDNSRLLADLPERANVYVTFPVGDVSNSPPDSDVASLVAAEVHRGVLSYEMFAFDSVLLLARAIKDVRRAEQPLNRVTLLSALRRVQRFPGVMSHYSFLEGENVAANYYVYGAGPAVSGKPCGVTQNPPRSAGMAYDCAISADPDLVANYVERSLNAQVLRPNLAAFQNRLH